MRNLPTHLFDEIVEALLPHMTTEDDRRTELLPVLSRVKYARIDWSGSSHCFTVRLVGRLSRAELIEVLGRLRVGEEQHRGLEQLCERLRHDGPVEQRLRRSTLRTHLATFAAGVALATSVAWQLDKQDEPAPIEACSEPAIHECPAWPERSPIFASLSPTPTPPRTSGLATATLAPQTADESPDHPTTPAADQAEAQPAKASTSRQRNFETDCGTVRVPSDLGGYLDHHTARGKCEDSARQPRWKPRRRTRAGTNWLVWEIEHGIKCECQLRN